MADEKKSSQKSSWRLSLRPKKGGSTRKDGKAPTSAVQDVLNSTNDPSTRQGATSSELSTQKVTAGTSPAFTDLAATEAASVRRDEYATNKTILWDEAYNRLKEDDSKLIKSYEDLLKDPQEGLSGDAPSGDNKSETERMISMLDHTLQVTANVDKFEARIRPAVDIILSVKFTIGTALSSVPIAAAAWTPICVVMQVSETSDSARRLS